MLKAALAFPIRALISLAAPPCLSTLAQRYTKLSTSSTFLSLIVNLMDPVFQERFLLFVSRPLFFHGNSVSSMSKFNCLEYWPC